MRFFAAFLLAALIGLADSAAHASPPSSSGRDEDARGSSRNRGNVVRPAFRRSSEASVAPHRNSSAGESGGGHGETSGGHGEGGSGRVVAPALGGHADSAGHGEGADSHGEETGHAEADGDNRDINLPVVVAPLSQDGRLSGYAFISMRMRPQQGVDPWRLRENAHFALDRLVRAAHAHDLSNVAGDGVNSEEAVAVFRAALAEYYGARAVGELDLVSVDTRMIRR